MTKHSARTKTLNEIARHVSMLPAVSPDVLAGAVEALLFTAATLTASRLGAPFDKGRITAAVAIIGPTLETLVQPEADPT